MKTSSMRFLVVLAVLAVSAFSVRADDNAVLFWQLSNPDVLQADGETTKTVAQMISEGAVTHARVQAYTMDVVGEIENYVEQGYLSFYRTETPTTPDTAFNSVKITSGTEAGYVYPMWASLGEYFDKSIYLGVELGTWNGDNWIVAATSEKDRILGLFGEGDRFIGTEELFTHLTTPWTATGFAVPEPTGGLLMVLGLAFFGLRRKGDLV